MGNVHCCTQNKPPPVKMGNRARLQQVAASYKEKSVKEPSSEMFLDNHISGHVARVVDEETNDSSEIVSVDKYTVVSRLGKGTHGTVYLCHDAEGTSFAMKVCQGSQKAAKHAALEYDLLLRVADVPGVVKVHDYMKSRRHVFLVVELVDGIPLCGLVRKEAPFSEYRAKLFFKDLLTTIADIHAVGVIHRDIKGENVLVDRITGQIKLCDFGLGAYAHSPEKILWESCGSPQYVAPEVIKKPLMWSGYKGRPADVWSSGVLLYEMLTGVALFESERGKPSSERLSGLFRMVEKADYSMEPAMHVSEEARDLLQRILVPHPDDRLTVDQILQHPWLKVNTSPFPYPHPVVRKAIESAKRNLNAKDSSAFFLQSTRGKAGQYSLGVPLSTTSLGYGVAGIPETCPPGRCLWSTDTKLSFHPHNATHPYAVHRLDTSKPNALPNLFKEITILSYLEGVNVFKVWEVFEQDHAIYTVTDLVIGESLRNLVAVGATARRSFRRQQYTQQLVNTMAQLHLKGVTHNNLSLDCIMWDMRRDRMVITDFSKADIGIPQGSRFYRAGHTVNFAVSDLSASLSRQDKTAPVSDVATVAQAQEKDTKGFLVSEDGVTAKIVYNYVPMISPNGKTPWHLYLWDTAEESTMITPPASPTAYHAPEVLAQKKYCGEAADVYAMGVVLLMIQQPQPPKWVDTLTREAVQERKRALYNTLSDSLRDFIYVRMLQQDPSARSRFAQLLQHDYLSSLPLPYGIDQDSDVSGLSSLRWLAEYCLNDGDEAQDAL